MLALPLYLMASEAGLVSTFWPVLFNPFGVCSGRILTRGYVPDEVLEAARVDGAGEPATYARVALRMLGPGLVTVFLRYYPVVLMGSLLAVLPLILAFVLLQRFWRSGLTAGAVK